LLQPHALLKTKLRIDGGREFLLEQVAAEFQRVRV